MASRLSNITPSDLRRAAALKEKIETLQHELELLLGGNARPAAKGGRRKRKMSAEARARIAEAQRKRWARQKRGAK